MIEILKAKISELQKRKDAIKNNTYENYELKAHLDTYIELTGIDYALKTLKEMLIAELEKNQKNKN